LLEVLPEGFSEILGYITFAGADALHTAIIKGCSGGAYSDYGKAVKNPEKMQSYNICYKIKKTGKWTVI